jgi:succinylglutamate desuccinylase
MKQLKPERNPAMDAVVSGIHGNEAFSLENVARSVREARLRHPPEVPPPACSPCNPDS